MSERHYRAVFGWNNGAPTIESTEILKKTAKRIVVVRAPASQHREYLTPDEVSLTAIDAILKAVLEEEEAITLARQNLVRREHRLAQLRELARETEDSNG
jgi:DNA polymerase sigma